MSRHDSLYPIFSLRTSAVRYNKQMAFQLIQRKYFPYMPKGVREELKAEKVVNGFSCRGMIHSIRPFLFSFLLSLTSLQASSHAANCANKRQTSVKSKRISRQYNSQQFKGKINMDFICLFDLGLDFKKKEIRMKPIVQTKGKHL